MKSTTQNTARMTAIATLALMMLSAPGAKAACVSQPRGPSPSSALPPSTLATPAVVHPMASASAGDSKPMHRNNDPEPSIIGLWKTSFVSGGAVVNVGFNTWHSDGTEWSLNSSTPPALGNVCPGVWEKTGPRTYSAVHPAFNYDPTGINIVSIFVERLNVTLSADGNSFEGTFTGDNFEFDGTPLPGSVEGTVTATRITVGAPFPFPIPIK